MYENNLNEIKGTIEHQHGNDEKQLEIIFTLGQKVIVEAPAGYGKTTTMISRIAYLFSTGRIPNPKKVLGLTFSVNAALKIKREVAEKLPVLVGSINNPTAVTEKVTVTNYHGFCKNILKKYGYLMTEHLKKDVNLFKAIGENEVDTSEALRKLLLCDDLNVFNKIEKIIKSGEFPDDELLKKYNEIIISKLLPLDYITHNAIILITIELLKTFSTVRKFYQNYYPLIIVDEFQDTNSISWELLKLLISEKSQLLFLGDPLQRIYGFIGALPNIMSVAKEEYDMERVVLTKNYRFQENEEMLKLDYNIRNNAKEGFKYDSEEKIAKVPALYGVTQEDEATQITVKVKHILEKEPNSKVAILCRGRNKNTDIIERVLSDNNVPYFYGLFTDEDDDYINFHTKCQNVFISRFGNQKTINKKALERFVSDIKNEYKGTNAKIELALVILLEALIKKISSDYSSISAEDKYLLMLDIFENRQLKQAMEYVDEKVIVTTVHGSKGLEWEYVFVPDLERWVFPSYHLCNECKNKFSQFVKCKCKIPDNLTKEEMDSLTEELSVFYVGVTRAKRQVFISASAKRYNFNNEEKSSGFSCMAALNGINLIKA